MEKKNYKYCVVPMCRNTTTRTPEKLFFRVPMKENVRKKWCQLMRRDNFKSNITSRHCCEDHFDLEEDVANYWKYKLMEAIPRLKPEAFPHKFECQKGGTRKSQVPERRAAAKRKILNILKDSEATFDVSGASTSQTELNVRGSSTLHAELNAPGPSTLQKELIEEVPVESILCNNKAIQVSFEPKLCSKGIQTNCSIANICRKSYWKTSGV